MRARLTLSIVLLLLVASVEANYQRYKLPYRIKKPIPPSVVVDIPPPDTGTAPEVLPGIPILTSDNCQSKINAYPAGTTFLFKAGIHRGCEILPRTGDIYNGEVLANGTRAVLNGSILITGWTSMGGNIWRSPAPSGELPYRNGLCEMRGANPQPGNGQFTKDWPRCSYQETLFVDDNWQNHESVLSQVGEANEWFYDYSADYIYLYSTTNPTGKKVELAQSFRAVSPYNPSFQLADNITIRRLVVEKYASASQFGCITAQDNDNSPMASGWIIRDNLIWKCHGAGVRVGHNARVTGNEISYHGQIGLVALGNSVLVENNTINYNNQAFYDEGWEAGGTKFVSTDGLIVRNNIVRYNRGEGLWTDIDNIRCTYQGNTSEWNTRSGIHHEVSRSCIIRDNIIRYNSAQWSAQTWGGGIKIASSRDVEIYNNVVAGNTDGIVILNQPRGTSIFGYEHVSINIKVYNNDIDQDNTFGATGDAVAMGAGEIFDSNWFNTANIQIYGNRYRLKGNNNYFQWLNTYGQSFPTWQGFGKDTTASGATAVVY